MGNLKSSAQRVLLFAVCLLLVAGTAGRMLAQEASAPSELDRVVAVVNNQAILSSDVADALRYAILDPEGSNGGAMTPRRALEQLISRSLIEQQIRQEDVSASQPSKAQIEARIQQIRRDLPVCVQEHCASDAGWDAFLLAHGLTNAEVEHYERLRLQILGFIETRFRQGIRISDEDIEAYYRDKLLPQYANRAHAPELKEVAPRIQEILLQQQVNMLFTSWLESLRRQGDVEVFDRSLEAPGETTPGSDTQ